MKVKEIMERVNSNQTGRIIAYIKDALNEINTISPIHVHRARINIHKSQRFYDLPDESIQILDIRCKDHDNEDGEYKSIPRMTYEPPTEDTDGI